MRLLLIVGALVLTFSINSIFAKDYMECIPSPFDCNYYKCIEDTKNCGKLGYPMRLGHRYCEKFGKRSNRFSPEGQVWLYSVRLCLQEELNRSVQELSCKKIKKKAADHHLKCYFETGFCQLSKQDQRKIYGVLGMAMMRPYFVKIGLKLLNKCRN